VLVWPLSAALASGDQPCCRAAEGYGLYAAACACASAPQRCGCCISLRHAAARAASSKLTLSYCDVRAQRHQRLYRRGVAIARSLVKRGRGCEFLQSWHEWSSDPHHCSRRDRTSSSHGSQLHTSAPAAARRTTSSAMLSSAARHSCEFGARVRESSAMQHAMYQRCLRACLFSESWVGAAAGRRTFARLVEPSMTPMFYSDSHRRPIDAVKPLLRLPECARGWRLAPGAKRPQTRRVPSHTQQKGVPNEGRPRRPFFTPGSPAGPRARRRRSAAAAAAAASPQCRGRADTPAGLHGRSVRAVRFVWLACSGRGRPHGRWARRKARPIGRHLKYVRLHGLQRALPAVPRADHQRDHHALLSDSFLPGGRALPPAVRHDGSSTLPNSNLCNAPRAARTASC
jgi:hypothetical protein